MLLITSFCPTHACTTPEINYMSKQILHTSPNFTSFTQPQPRVIGGVSIRFNVEFYVTLINFLNKEMVIVVFELNKFRIISRVETKQGMKQLEDHKVMDPQLLFLLVSGVAILVRLKGGHDAGFKLTIKLGGRGPKFVQVKTAPSNITSHLVDKILVHPWDRGCTHKKVL